jgi:protein ImuB
MFGGLHSASRTVPAAVLLDVARAFTPRVERRDAATVLLDLHGLGRTWRSPEALGAALVDDARRRELQPQVALAWSRVAAVVLARSVPGLTVVSPGRESDALAPLPLAALGLEPPTGELLRRWGLRTLGDLAALPPGGLAERLGAQGPRLVRLARGEDERPLVPLPPPRTFRCALDLDWPVDGMEPLSFLLARVLDPLAASLRAGGQLAASLTLELSLVDGTRHARTCRPATPMGEPRTWRTLLLLDLEAHPPAEAVQAIAVTAEPTAARATQFSLLDAAQPAPERMAELMARLLEWTAEGRGGSPALVDTHRPGAFVMGPFAPSPPGAKRHGLAVVSEGAAAWGERAARAVLRAYRPPRPATVELKDDAPSFVMAPGVRGEVLGWAGPWRASGDWWDVAWSRDEWDVALAGGVYRVFRDRLAGAWFVAGEVD